jgi:hypothetical protein
MRGLQLRSCRAGIPNFWLNVFNFGTPWKTAGTAGVARSICCSELDAVIKEILKVKRTTWIEASRVQGEIASRREASLAGC